MDDSLIRPRVARRYLVVHQCWVARRYLVGHRHPRDATYLLKGARALKVG
jgi:hypothetical protein